MKNQLSSISAIALPSLLVCICCADVCLAWPWSNDQRKAEKHFKAGDFEEALHHYENARLRDPDNPALDYNVGNVLHADSRFQEATGEYSRTINRSDSGLREVSYYNLGNTFFRMGDVNKAIESYVRALLENPEDYDAKHNLEMALKMLEQQQQKQEKEKRGESEQEEKEEQQPEERKEEEEEKQPEPKEGEMSKEQAERILNALEAQEKKERKELEKSKAKAKVYVEKDW